MLACDACAGEGKIKGILCIRCDGWGNSEHARLLRARDLGWRECAEAMKAVKPIPQVLDENAFAAALRRSELSEDRTAYLEELNP